MHRRELDRGLLLAAGPASRHHPGATRMPPLVEASMRGDAALVEQMLRTAYEDVNQLDEESMSALHWACAYGEPNIVRTLLGDGRVNPSVRNKRGGTPLHQATLSGAHEIMRILLSDHRSPSFVDAVNVWGETSLILAATRGDAIAARLLLDHGADPKHQDQWGKTPWEVAEDYGEKECCAVLKEHVQGHTSAVPATDKPAHTPAPTPSAPPAVVPPGGRVLSKMMEAPLNEQQTLSWIEDTTIDLNGSDYYKLTALHKCAAWEKPIVLQRLLLHPNIQVATRGPDGDTALHMAASSGAIKCTTFIIEDGRIHVDTKNDHGNTSLMLAASTGMPDMVQMLIKAAADINATNAQGKTAWNFAKDSGHDDLAASLWSMLSPAVQEACGPLYVPPKPRVAPVRKKLAARLIQVQEQVREGEPKTT
eukprot:TRINITY_DN7435_c0_g1_i2.p1 TRINITY_DN7435_c0_g1~~TRINITY_DN7435_c0_g1_i2.p1  ORF type:complete len:422 (-),score=79.82 TRINITY_DN7435_c0_g1_i2:71-1336(-)